MDELHSYALARSTSIDETSFSRSMSLAVRKAKTRHLSMASSCPSPELDSSLLVEEHIGGLGDHREMPFTPEQAQEKVVGILTSGGDAPGMNAAVRAATAVCLNYSVPVYAIHDGYAGLIKGGESVRRLSWEAVSDILHKGGTYIGSARCDEFRTREGRRRAAHTLVQFGINSLIVIGGDGTLTGANLFRSEWAALLDELQQKGEISAEQQRQAQYLSVMGIVGSIDNDMSGFSMTVGCDTALQRIIEAIDALVTTAESHQRTFIVEVMGRHCGFLALMAGLACAADWVFVPENPCDDEEWERVLCQSLANRRRQGLNYSLIILAEGSTDRVRRPITAQNLQQILIERLHHDTRITTLGHVQRGGAPSAYDRILGTRLGAEAALALFSATAETPARICGIHWNQVVLRNLQATVEQTRSVSEALRARDFKRAAALRGATYQDELRIYLHTRRMKVIPKGPRRRFALLTAGDPAAGMNACAMVAVRYLMNDGHLVFAVGESFEGLAHGDLKEMTWESVCSWMQLGGSVLGTNAVLPSKVAGVDGIKAIADTLEKYQIQGLLAIGGFEAYEGLLELMRARPQHPALHIPMALVPATICNNVPGTDVSIGSDTALNFITDAIDRLKQSARSRRRRVFVVETFGGFAGYLAIMGALAGGADDVFTYEEKVHIEDLQATIAHVRKKLQTSPHAVLVRNECCSINYNTQFVQALFEEEGSQSTPPFSTRSNILGHLQEGGTPSPLDRVRAARLAAKAAEYLEQEIDKACGEDGKMAATGADSCFVVGVNAKVAKRDMQSLEAVTDFEHFTPTDLWWTRFVSLVRLLENNTSRQPAPPYFPEATIDDSL